MTFKPVSKYSCGSETKYIPALNVRLSESKHTLCTSRNDCVTLVNYTIFYAIFSVSVWNERIISE
jgi:hypothetical protein